MTDALTPSPQDQSKPIVWGGVEADAFSNSPLSDAYWNVRNELRQRDDKGKSRAWHHRVSLWATWESHKSSRAREGEHNGKTLLSIVGLPETQKEFAELLGVSSRTIRQYGQKHADLVGNARASGIQQIMDMYQTDVLHALGQMASSPDYRTATDRKTYLTLAGMLNPKGDAPAREEDKEAQVQVYLPSNEESNPD